VTLDAVQNAALDGASAEAQAIKRAARNRAEQTVVEARAHAAALLAGRRAAAEALADLEERERLAQARGDARATILRAQRAVLNAATTAVRAAAVQLIHDPRYERLNEALTAEARRRLAGTGPVQIVTAPSGGFIASAGSRELDYSLSAQVERHLSALGGELERLWR
jgi:vacuolar-type H+-ATPase subunit E/Vma4